MNVKIFLKDELEILWNEHKNLYHTAPEVLELCSLCCLRCGKPMPQNLSESTLSRYADVGICPDCGTDEAMRDYAKNPIPLRDWYAAASACVKQEFQLDTAYLIDICEFPSVFKETKAIPLSSTRHPVSEVVYSRSDYDGSRWWTTWQNCQKTHVEKKLAQEIDAFHAALFDMPEMKNLASMRGLKKYAELTKDANEFNLYSETEHFYIWLRFILREKDYNLYCHYYLK